MTQRSWKVGRRGTVRTGAGLPVRWRWRTAVCLTVLLAAGGPAAARPLLASGSFSGSGSSADASDQGGHANLRKAGLSLILPGLAQLRMGKKTEGISFLVADAGFWTGFAAWRIQGLYRKDSYIEMAQIYAGVQHPEGQSEDYYRLIGSWPSSASYEENIRIEARDLYPNDVKQREAYFEAHQVPADQAWNWETYAAWNRYLAKRDDADRSYRRSRIMLGLAAANRLAAFLDAAILSSRGAGRKTLGLSVTPGESPASAVLRLSYSFR